MIEGTDNEKFVSRDWFSREVVFYGREIGVDQNPVGERIVNNTAEDMGTPNVYSGDNLILKFVVHGYYDVLPYMLWGNDWDDTTTFIDRVIMGVS